MSITEVQSESKEEEPKFSQDMVRGVAEYVLQASGLADFGLSEDELTAIHGMLNRIPASDEADEAKRFDIIQANDRKKMGFTCSERDLVLYSIFKMATRLHEDQDATAAGSA